MIYTLITILIFWPVFGICSRLGHPYLGVAFGLLATVLTMVILFWYDGKFSSKEITNE